MDASEGSGSDEPDAPKTAEEKKEARRVYRLRNADQIREYRKIYRQKNPERRRQERARYRLRHREEYNAAKRRYRARLLAADPEGVRAKYRAQRDKSYARNRDRSCARERLLYARRRDARALSHFDAIRRAIPASYPAHVRDDIAGSMYVALAERKLKPADIALAAPNFIRAYWSDNSPYDTVSLDVRIGDGTTTYLDQLAEDQGLANFI